MTEQQIQEIADRIAAALEGLAPADSPWWAWLPALTPLAALIAAIVAAVIGYQNLKAQQRALKATVRSNARNLRQKREADSRSEWWRRTQWALEAARDPDDGTMYSYGTGVLRIQAKSNLITPEDKELLDAVWEDSPSEMDPDYLSRLVKDAEEILTQEEVAELYRRHGVDVPPGTGDNIETKEDAND